MFLYALVSTTAAIVATLFTVRWWNWQDKRRVVVNIDAREIIFENFRFMPPDPPALSLVRGALHDKVCCPFDSVNRIQRDKTRAGYLLSIYTTRGLVSLESSFSNFDRLFEVLVEWCESRLKPTTDPVSVGRHLLNGLLLFSFLAVIAVAIIELLM